MADTSSPSPATDREARHPPLTFGELLRRGLVAGALGGLALALCLRRFGSDAIAEAISIEAAHRHDGATGALFSRGTQEVGGMLGTAAYGVLSGLVATVVFASIRHQLRMRSDGARAIAVAGLCFVTLNLVPFLKYPADPPGVGSADTIGRRTASYLVLVGVSALSSVAVLRAVQRLRVRGSLPSTIATAATALYVGLIAAAYLVLPSFHDTGEVPAGLLWRFRISSLGGLVAQWTVYGLAFGWLLERRTSRGVTA